MALGKNIYSLNSCRYDYLYGCTLVNNIQHLSKIISASLASEQQTFDENISKNGLEYLQQVKKTLKGRLLDQVHKKSFS